jgi:hypothetical protein
MINPNRKHKKRHDKFTDRKNWKNSKICSDMEELIRCRDYQELVRNILRGSMP